MLVRELIKVLTDLPQEFSECPIRFRFHEVELDIRAVGWIPPGNPLGEEQRVLLFNGILVSDSDGAIVEIDLEDDFRPARGTRHGPSEEGNPGVR